MDIVEERRMIKMKEENYWDLNKWKELTKNDTEQEQYIPNRFRIAWIHSDPEDPTRWPGLREQLRGIESFLCRDVIRWKYRQKLLSYAEEMGLICNKIDPIAGIEAWGAIGGERWMIIPKEELEDEDVEVLKAFLKVEE